MIAYRIDEYLGAATECKAVFFEKRDAIKYSELYPYDNLGIVEIEIEDDFYNNLFNCEKGKVK